jgi:signal transduction histidine kinase/CheY-like chemotaxis protein
MNIESRILLHAPVGKDALLASQALERAGLECRVCASMQETLDELDKGASCLFIVEEALDSGWLKPLIQYVSLQPTWSDLPILILTSHGLESPGLQNVVGKLGNFTLLERPVRATSLISAARSALRGRLRQYQMRENDRMKDEFLASLGHELRNPLAPIRTSMQVLDRMFPATERVRVVTQVVERQVSHLTRLVDDLLDVARITSGKVNLQRRQVALADIISHTLEICRPLMESGRHHLEVEQPPHAVLLDADPARLVQSLANVLSNAVKFSPASSTIFLRAAVDGERLVFTVKDSGVGLEPESLSRIFEMFVQSDPLRGQVLGGLGIGLSLTKRFTEMHGGTIHALSEGLGHGCEFVLTLPIVLKQELAAGVAALASIDDKAPGAQFPILVVDDNKDGADMLEMMLQLEGHTVYKAYTGQEAVDLAKHARPHVVLMDIGLPDFDGYEAARRIRLQPGGQNLVMVALTGWGHDEARQKAGEAGMNHHMVKPVDLSVLREYLLGATRMRPLPS